MAIDMTKAPIPKGEPRRRAKARARRKEAAVIKSVRPRVVERDGYCRLIWDDAGIRATIIRLFGPCTGPSEWAHFGERKRSKTIGMEPDYRHDRRWSLMMCRGHHANYDHGPLDIEELTDAICDGRLRFSQNGQSWEEPAE